MDSNVDPIVTVDPEVLGGTPVFAGTRVPIQTLVAHLKCGDSLETFLTDFPSVSKQQVDAFLDQTLESAMENAADAHSS